MADAALRMNDRIGSDIVRRLVARPMRADVAGAPPAVAAILATAASEGADHGEDETAFEGEPSADVSRLQAEVMVMKAVLKSERTEHARLRAQVAQVSEVGPMSDEARAMRDRWAALVDQLLQSPR